MPLKNQIEPLSGLVFNYTLDGVGQAKLFEVHYGKSGRSYLIFANSWDMAVAFLIEAYKALIVDLKEEHERFLSTPVSERRHSDWMKSDRILRAIRLYHRRLDDIKGHTVMEVKQNTIYTY